MLATFAVLTRLETLEQGPEEDQVQRRASYTEAEAGRTVAGYGLQAQAGARIDA